MTRLGIACGLPWMLASCYGAGSVGLATVEVGGVTTMMLLIGVGGTMTMGAGGGTATAMRVRAMAVVSVARTDQLSFTQSILDAAFWWNYPWMSAGVKKDPPNSVQWTPLPEIACRIAANGTGRKADIGAQLGPWVQDYERSNTVVNSSNVNRWAPATRFKWNLKLLTAASQSPPMWGAWGE
ncbi:hypothetical protein FF38_09965 [Lucilia cuprina]|uniref:Uncharacterized protein n=1 Tax=Lucilia cuprina TaxID=7375 RepID=A0A0L0C8L7_LUCCU|nr:hypothetical protein FF38_09965 [Lucilia cuprina]